ncbi:DegT/DnrJ/EryC1/StrS family aminotransferase [Haloarchaeobius baliensis]|uniref:DegT/DnrJ/EryC1/StrS family aminotransferase n=1 Tax=Haloarchaeobius baliensis TaxID=1670458 RepID=UPI003F88471A
MYLRTLLNVSAMEDSIPLIEPVVGDEELENVKAVLESGYMTQGPYSDEFEESFSSFVDAEHGITITSCTTGLDAVLEALDIGEGDEVVVPDFTHPATANVVAHRGATPVLVDVDENTYNIDHDALESAVGEETGAVIPVSWGGQPLDPAPLRRLQDEYDFAVVEDAACSAGAAYDGGQTGSQFDASVFSFHPRKVLTTGEGGMITTDDDDLERAIREIKNFGTVPSDPDVGFRRASASNYRMSDILAAVGVAQMEKRDDIIGTRQSLAERYTDLVADIDGVRAPFVPEASEHVFQAYCVYIEAGDENTRDQILDAMRDRNIETQIGTYALHLTEAFGDAKRVGSLDASAGLQDNLLTLPIAHSMTDADQDRVVAALDEELDAYR